ncbi:MAG: tRNA adenosine(34) deaminase TadA [Lachnospiraceae bacterium]|nr:tRNA adenosine(34) deaminase TadA [Lachnospiraceae bacterium]
MTQEKLDEKYMRAALKQAEKAYALGEVPIGCVIVCGDRIIGRGYNRRNTDKSTLSHAEITAVRKAVKVIGDWRLEGCTIYITLEPCPMCAGAIVQSRMDRCVIGAMSPKSGCAGSVLNLLEEERFNHQVEMERGVLQEECAAILQRFFRELRIREKALKIMERADIEEGSGPGPVEGEAIPE